MLLLLMLLLSTADASDCPASTADVATAVVATEGAYAALQEDRFRWSHHEALRLLGCVDAPVSQGLAADLHLIEVLDARLAGDTARLDLAILGLVTTAPEFTPDPRLAPPGGSLDRAIELAREDSWPTDVQRFLDDQGAWVINGQAAIDLPLDRSSVVQRRDDDGAIATWYLHGAPLPDELRPRPLARISRPQAVGALGLGAASGLAWIVASAASTRPGDLRGDEPANDGSRVAAWTGMGLGAGALGLGAAAIVTARWSY